MTQDDARLDQWLAEMYRVDNLGVGGRDDVFRRARSTIAADPTLLSLAKGRIPTLEKLVKSRGDSVHVEKKQLQYLKHVTQENVDG